ncbi:MAG TPA: HipA N-terminal domain-containing protein, partial [Variovorax sp.]|nr:HipA N-terminal domain-containing protein [Variovorax sp.]
MTTGGHDRPMPCDALSLWMLTVPAHPVRVGVISLALNGQAVALRYEPQWLRRGYALSEDLPLVDDLFVPTRRQEAAGAVEDARPGRWGERVIRRFERSPRMSLLEFLPFAGPDRYGALGVSRRLDACEPWPASPIPVLGDLPAMQEVIRKVVANEPVAEIERRLLRPGVSLGGARPKSLIAIDGEPWLV